MDINSKRKTVVKKTKGRNNNSVKSIEHVSKDFICIGSNGIQMIIDTMLNMEMKMLSDVKDSQYYVKWTDVAQQIDWDLYTEFTQLINHVPNSEWITNKGNLLHCLRQYDRLAKVMQKSYVIDMESFVPESYLISNPKELSRFYDNISSSPMWIYKPTGLNQGIGISLIRERGDLVDVLAKDQSDDNRYRRAMGKIVQRYIMNPLLINNKKFDIRAYMLIGNTTPFLVLYHPGYLRLSMEDYSNDSDNLLIHLTNQFIQKKDPKYKDVKDDTVWSMEQFNRHCNDHLDKYPNIGKNWVLYVLNNRIKTIMRHVFFSVKNKLSRGVGLFELFGFDFMIDSDFKIWLIEVNMNPAMSTNCEVLKQKLPLLIKSTLDVSIECFEKCQKQEGLLPLTNQGKFETIYYEETNWSWQQYINNNKDMLSSMKIRKLSNTFKMQRSSQNRFLKHPQSQDNRSFQKFRSQSVPLENERKFPLNITNKDYHISVFQRQQRSNLIKT